MLLKLAGLPRRLYFGAVIINRNGPFPSAGAYLCTWVGLPIPLQSRRTIPISMLVRQDLSWDLAFFVDFLFCSPFLCQSLGSLRATSMEMACLLLQGTYTERHRKLHSRKYIVAVGIAEESTMEYALPGGIPGKRHFFFRFASCRNDHGKRKRALQIFRKPQEDKSGRKDNCFIQIISGRCKNFKQITGSIHSISPLEVLNALNIRTPHSPEGQLEA